MVLYDFSNARRGGKFINVSCVVADDGVAGLPFDGSALLVWGSGLYRASDAYLACAPLGDPSRPDPLALLLRWRARLAATDVVRGRERRARAVPASGDRRALGHLERAAELWLLLYNAGSPRGINARVSRLPWGPWSDPVVVFDPRWSGTGYGDFMHVKDQPDGLSDPGREGEWGASTGRT